MLFELLEQFEVVASTLNFRKAAELLHVSHSTISRNIATLERYLGAELFYRDSKTLSLTPAGQVLYNKSSAISNDIRELKTEIARISKGSAGHLSISSISLNCAELYLVYRLFLSHHPNINLSLTCMDVPQIIESVSTGRSDIGITYSYFLPDNPDKYEFISFLSGEYIVVMDKNHRLSYKDSMTSEEIIAEQPLIAKLPHDHKGLARLIAQNDTAHQPIGLRSVLLTLPIGHDIALLPYHTAHHYCNNCNYKIARISDCELKYEVVLFWKKDNKNQSLPYFTELFKRIFNIA